jgi:hypothetical protein
VTALQTLLPAPPSFALLRRRNESNERHDAPSLEVQPLLRSWLLILWGSASLRVLGQCAGIATTPTDAADCAVHALPQDRVAAIDPGRPYTLAELIDIGERNNPRTRILRERAKQRVQALGVEKSAYYPVLAGLAAFGDQRTIVPFPKPLAPRGYTMVEIPVVQPEITLQYLIFDFGKREGKVDEAAAQKIAAGANFIAANQQVAFRVASSYYGLLTAQERLEAARETLKTAQTTQDAAEDRLNNGRATQPDALNARAETAQSEFDLEFADGDEKIARVTLTEAVGADPSPNILIDGQKDTPLPQTLALSIDSLIDRAMANRPDLQAQAAKFRDGVGRTNLAGPPAHTWALEQHAANTAFHRPDLARVANFADAVRRTRFVFRLHCRARQPRRLPALHLLRGFFGRRRRNGTGNCDSDRQRSDSSVFLALLRSDTSPEFSFLERLFRLSARRGVLSSLG